jgi:beta-glucosidase
MVASVTRPVKELRGFERVTLTPKEQKTISFTLTGEHIGFYDQYMEFVVEPGTFTVWVGPDSTTGLEGQFEVVEHLPERQPSRSGKEAR